MRKRRTKYQWFLPTGTVGPAADTDDSTNGRVLALGTVANATSAITIVDLLNDTPSEDVTLAQATVFPMAGTIGNEYFIRRIVGKWFVGMATDSNGPLGALVGAGIFIARAGDFRTAAGAENLPIGGANIDSYSPISPENIREPWIWRRVWVLGNSGAGGATSVIRFPGTNAGYGSVLDGPHIDAKTARRVRDGERLFAVLAVRNFPIDQTSTGTVSVDSYLDYRVLGAMRKAHNRSTF